VSFGEEFALFLAAIAVIAAIVILGVWLDVFDR
jgi:hypothetical protein